MAYDRRNDCGVSSDEEIDVVNVSDDKPADIGTSMNEEADNSSDCTSWRTYPSEISAVPVDSINSSTSHECQHDVSNAFILSDYEDDDDGVGFEAAQCKKSQESKTNVEKEADENIRQNKQSNVDFWPEEFDAGIENAANAVTWFEASTSEYNLPYEELEDEGMNIGIETVEDEGASGFPKENLDENIHQKACASGGKKLKNVGNQRKLCNIGFGPEEIDGGIESTASKVINWFATSTFNSVPYDELEDERQNIYREAMLHVGASGSQNLEKEKVQNVEKEVDGNMNQKVCVRGDKKLKDVENQRDIAIKKATRKIIDVFEDQYNRVPYDELVDGNSDIDVQGGGGSQKCKELDNNDETEFNETFGIYDIESNSPKTEFIEISDNVHNERISYNSYTIQVADSDCQFMRYDEIIRETSDIETEAKEDGERSEAPQRKELDNNDETIFNETFCLYDIDSNSPMTEFIEISDNDHDGVSSYNSDEIPVPGSDYQFVRCDEFDRETSDIETDAKQDGERSEATQSKESKSTTRKTTDENDDLNVVDHHTKSEGCRLRDFYTGIHNASTPSGGVITLSSDDSAAFAAKYDQNSKKRKLVSSATFGSQRDLEASGCALSTYELSDDKENTEDGKGSGYPERKRQKMENNILSDYEEEAYDQNAYVSGDNSSKSLYTLSNASVYFIPEEAVGIRYISSPISPILPGTGNDSLSNDSFEDERKDIQGEEKEEGEASGISQCKRKTQKDEKLTNVEDGPAGYVHKNLDNVNNQSSTFGPDGLGPPFLSATSVIANLEDHLLNKGLVGFFSRTSTEYNQNLKKRKLDSSPTLEFCRRVAKIRISSDELDDERKDIDAEENGEESDDSERNEQNICESSNRNLININSESMECWPGDFDERINYDPTSPSIRYDSEIADDAAMESLFNKLLNRVAIYAKHSRVSGGEERGKRRRVLKTRRARDNLRAKRFKKC